MRLGDAPWTRVRDALASGEPCVAILPCGAVEAHGPHLPLTTDVIISEAFSDAAADTLNRDGVVTFVLPALAYAPSEYAAAFEGTIGVGAETAKRMILDIVATLQRQGFTCLAIANSHFDPANVAMLRDAVAEARALGLPIAFPDFTRRALAATLTEEFVSGACHAGQFETSIVLAARPDLVDNALRTALPPNPASLTEAMGRGVTTFHDAGGPDAYFGAPADASSAEGAATIAAMASAIVDAVREALAQAGRSA
ncbi:MAG: creatininase family protein [Hyphomonadaceae bacterium]|nr:creatininase family protein [Hyphomonadaceae bacterium]